jgi:hypothetical protein
LLREVYFRVSREKAESEMANATYLQLATIAQSAEFQQRVNAAMNAAAANIYNEGSGVANHSARAAFAIKVVTGNYNLPAAAQAIIMASAIVAEATIPTPFNTTAILDTDIFNSVASLWNMFAGV